jgi:tetratricopeptide (TPR) repeat protein
MLVEALLLSGRHTDVQRVVSELPAPLAGQPFVKLALGRIDLAERRPAAAAQHFLAAGIADGRNLRVQVFLGQAYLDLRRWADARRAFQQALDLEAGHAEALYGLCAVSLREGDSNTAVKFAAAAVESNPALPGAYYYLGVALLNVGRYVEAASALERAVDLNPTIRGARRRLVRLYNGELGDPARARAHAERLEQLRLERRSERAAHFPPLY